MLDFSFDFMFHWLSITVWPEEGKDVINLCRNVLNSSIVGCDLVAMGHGGQGYDNIDIWNGVRLYYGGNDGTVSIVISGEWVSSWNLGELRGFIEYFKDNGLRWRCSRLDLAFDVEPDKMDINTVFDAVSSREYVCRAQNRGAYIDFGSDEKTITLGSRPSERYMRIYNRRGYVRFELEVKGKAAGFIGALLLDADSLSAYHKVVPLAVGVLKDYVRFVIKD